MNRFVRSVHDEEGRAGPTILLALTGLVIGAPLGFLGGGLIARVFCASGDGSFGAGESCGMAFVVLSFFGVPVGAAIGAIVGAIVGHRRGRVVVPSAPPEYEAPVAAWLAVAGGVAIAFGAFGGWRTVSVPSTQVDRLGSVLSSGPEPIAFLEGLLILVGGVLRVLRPEAPAPAALIGVGAVLAVVGVIWGFADFARVPSDLTKQLLPGVWISLLGSVLSLAGLISDRVARATWHRWRRVPAI